MVSEGTPRHRPGIWTISRSISLGVSFAIGGFIAVQMGWRAAFLIAGIPGMLLSLLILFTMRDAKAPVASAGGHAEKSSLRTIWQALMQNRSLLLLAIAAVLVVACQNGLMAFMSAFLTRVHHLPVDRAGLAVGVILGAGAGFAYTAILGAYLNESPAAVRGALSAFITLLIIFVGSGTASVAGRSTERFTAAIAHSRPVTLGIELDDRSAGRRRRLDCDCRRSRASSNR